MRQSNVAKWVVVDRYCFGLSQEGVCNDTRSVPKSGMLLPFAVRTSAGFPVPSFCSEWFRSPAESEPPMDMPVIVLVSQGRGPAAISAWAIDDALRVFTDHTVPLRPIWLGLLFNTLFYATLLWLAIPGPFALRRLLRVRRGLCPKCAYPMGESAVCSECGRELARRVAT